MVFFSCSMLYIHARSICVVLTTKEQKQTWGAAETYKNRSNCTRFLSLKCGKWAHVEWLRDHRDSTLIGGHDYRCVARQILQEPEFEHVSVSKQICTLIKSVHLDFILCRKWGGGGREMKKHNVWIRRQQRLVSCLTAVVGQFCFHVHLCVLSIFTAPVGNMTHG